SRRRFSIVVVALSDRPRHWQSRALARRPPNRVHEPHHVLFVGLLSSVDLERSDDAMSGASSGPLSDDDVTHFEARGYVWLPGGWGRGRAAEGRDRLTRLIRTDPSVIRELHPAENAGRLTAFDPLDPGTWLWWEIRAGTGADQPLQELAPRVHAATVQLLG